MQMVMEEPLAVREIAYNNLITFSLSSLNSDLPFYFYNLYFKAHNRISTWFTSGYALYHEKNYFDYYKRNRELDEFISETSSLKKIARWCGKIGIEPEATRSEFEKIYNADVDFLGFYQLHGLLEPTEEVKCLLPGQTANSQSAFQTSTQTRSTTIPQRASIKSSPTYVGTCEGTILTFKQTHTNSHDYNSGFAALNISREAFAKTVIRFLQDQPAQAELLAEEFKRMHEKCTSIPPVFYAKITRLLSRMGFASDVSIKNNQNEICSEIKPFKTLPLVFWEILLGTDRDGLDLACRYIELMPESWVGAQQRTQQLALSSQTIKLWALATQTPIYLWRPTCDSTQSATPVRCTLNPHSPQQDLFSFFNTYHPCKHLLQLDNSSFGRLKLDMNQAELKSLYITNFRTLNRQMTDNANTQPEQQASQNHLAMVLLKWRIQNLETTQDELQQTVDTMTQRQAHTTPNPPNQTNITQELDALKAQLQRHHELLDMPARIEAHQDLQRIEQSPQLSTYYHHLRMIFTVFCTATQMISSGKVKKDSWCARDLAFMGLTTACSFFVTPLLASGFSLLANSLTSHFGSLVTNLPDPIKNLFSAEHVVNSFLEVGEIREAYLNRGHNPGLNTAPTTEPKIDNHWNSLSNNLKHQLTPETTLLMRIARMTCTISEMEDLVDTVARWLTLRYQHIIEACTLTGAQRFAECSMARLIEYIEWGGLKTGTAVNAAARRAVARELVTMVAHPYLCSKFAASFREVKIEQRPKAGGPKHFILESHLHCYSGLAIHTPTEDGNRQVTYYNDSNKPELSERIDTAANGYRIATPGQGLANEVEEFGLIPAATQPETVPAAVVTQPRPEPAPSTPVITQTSNVTGSASHESARQAEINHLETKAEENNQIKQLVSELEKKENENLQLQNDMQNLAQRLQTIEQQYDQTLLSIATIMNAQLLPTRAREPVHHLTLREARRTTLQSIIEETSARIETYQSPLTQTTTQPTQSPPPAFSQLHHEENEEEEEQNQQNSNRMTQH